MLLNSKTNKDPSCQGNINNISFCLTTEDIGIFDYKLVQRIESLVLIFSGFLFLSLL